MQHRFSPSLITLCGGFVLLAAPTVTLRSQTVNLPITNFSFENPVVTEATPNVGIPGWTVVGNALSALNTPLNETVLVTNPTNAEYPGTTGQNGIGSMDGVQIASFRAGLLNLAGDASQISGSLLALNTQYSLKIAVGNPLNSVFQGYTISLLVGGTTLASVDQTTGGVPADGTFQDVTINYLLPANLAALANTPIAVNLSVPAVTLGSLGTNYGTDFDNVRFTATPLGTVPEPSTYATVGFGLLGLLGAQAARRRRHPLLAKA